MERGKLWLLFVLFGIALVTLVANLLPSTIEYRLIFLIINQVLLVIGGVLGSSKKILHRPNVKALTHGLLWGIIIFVINSIVGSVTSIIAALFLGNEQVMEMIYRDQSGVISLLKIGNPLITFIMSFLLIIGAPLSEELFFRGFLINFWRNSVGVRRAILFSALIFSILHFYVLQFPQVLISGAILGFLFVRTKSVTTSVIAHGVVNALGLMIALSQL